jgi:hypothetical protein
MKFKWVSFASRKYFVGTDRHCRQRFKAAVIVFFQHRLYCSYINQTRYCLTQIFRFFKSINTKLAYIRFKQFITLHNYKNGTGKVYSSWKCIHFPDAFFVTASLVFIFIKYCCIHEGVSKSFRTGRLVRELQMVQLSATRCSCIAIL